MLLGFADLLAQPRESLTFPMQREWGGWVWEEVRVVSDSFLPQSGFHTVQSCSPWNA